MDRRVVSIGEISHRGRRGVPLSMTSSVTHTGGLNVKQMVATRKNCGCTSQTTNACDLAVTVIALGKGTAFSSTINGSFSLHSLPAQELLASRCESGWWS